MDVDVILSNMKKEFGEESKKFETLRDEVIECAEVTDNDHCEAASKIFECVGLVKDNDIPSSL